MTDVEHARQTIQLIRELSNELAGYIHTLPDDIWRNAEQYGSVCEGWTIADVITHLIAGASRQSEGIPKSLAGNPSPPMGGFAPLGSQEAIEHVIALRDAYFEDLFWEFNGSCKRLNTQLMELEPEHYELPTWHPSGVMPMSRRIDIRAMELAIHGWDIRYSLDRSAKINEKAIPFLKGWLRRWMRATFQRRDKLDTPLRYRFELEDPVPDSYDVLISGDNLHLAASNDVAADVTFRCDASAYILFNMGRLPFNRSVRRGLLSFEGDEQLASEYTTWFKAF